MGEKERERKRETFDDIFQETFGARLYEKVDNLGNDLININYHLQTPISMAYGFVMMLPTTIFTLIESPLEVLIKRYTNKKN